MGEHTGGERTASSATGSRLPRSRSAQAALAALLAVLVVAGGVLVQGRAAGGYAPAVLLRRVALAPGARTTPTGVPVPVGAQRCATGGRAAAGGVRWCPPVGVSAATLDRWYARTLPAGQDAGGLRWCVGQVLANGTHRALWTSGTSLVGYDLPEPGHGRRAVVDLLRLPEHRCPAAARTSRQAAS